MRVNFGAKDMSSYYELLLTYPVTVVKHEFGALEGHV